MTIDFRRSSHSLKSPWVLSTDRRRNRFGSLNNFIFFTRFKALVSIMSHSTALVNICLRLPNILLLAVGLRPFGLSGFNPLFIRAICSCSTRSVVNLKRGGVPYLSFKTINNITLDFCRCLTPLYPSFILFCKSIKVIS